MNAFQRLAVVLCLASLPTWALDVPAGKSVRVRLGQTIDSAKARSGDPWDGTLTADIVVNGNVVAKRGAPVHGKVVEAVSSGRLSNPGLLRLQLTSIDGSSVRSRTVARRGSSHTKSNTMKIGGGAALGAAIGAIAGGGKGAAIGAGAGAAAGTAGAAATGKKDVRFPVETVLTFVIR